MSVGDFLYTLRHHAKMPANQAVLLDAAIAAAEESVDVSTAQAAADAAQTDATSGIADAATAQTAADDAQTDADTLLAAAIVTAIDASADVGSGGTTVAVGFQLKDENGNDLAIQPILKFGTYDDIYGETTAANATLNTATAGTIISGAASSVLVVEPDATGKFTCTLTNASDEIVNQMCSALIRSPALNTEDYDAVEFTA